MAKKSRSYIWQFVIGLGFLSGLWTAIGIDPQEFFLNILGKAVETVYSNPVIRSLFLLLPVILFLISVYGAYNQGRYLGLISVIIAYLAGLFILDATLGALGLLGIAIITGYVAPKRHLVKKLARI